MFDALVRVSPYMTVMAGFVFLWATWRMANRMWWNEPYGFWAGYAAFMGVATVVLAGLAGWFW